MTELCPILRDVQSKSVRIDGDKYQAISKGISQENFRLFSLDFGYLIVFGRKNSSFFEQLFVLNLMALLL